MTPKKNIENELKIVQNIEKSSLFLCLVAGGIYGYSDSQNIKLENNLENILNYLPASIFVGLNISETQCYRNYYLEKFMETMKLNKMSTRQRKKILKNAFIGTTLISTGIGASTSFLGYSLGYCAGKLIY